MIHITVVYKFIHTNVRNNSVSEFIYQGNAAMKSGALKSYHQSEIGVISSRYKVGADSRIYLGSRGFNLELRGRQGPTVPAVNIVPLTPICRNTVGSPSQRNISKIYLSVIQITLKVKYAFSISLLSPIFTLFQDSYKWLVICTVNSIIVCDDNNTQLSSYEVCSYRLDHISSNCQDLYMGLTR